jgi:hypothetical protein
MFIPGQLKRIGTNKIYFCAGYFADDKIGRIKSAKSGFHFQQSCTGSIFYLPLKLVGIYFMRLFYQLPVVSVVIADE